VTSGISAGAVANRLRAHERFFTRALFCSAVALLVALPISATVKRHRSRAGPAPDLAAHLPAGARGRPALLVVLQPRDCESYRGFVEAMTSLRGTVEGDVMAVPVNSPSGPDALREAFARLAPRLPVVPEASRDAMLMLAALGYRDTPVALLVDAAGRPAMVIQPQPDPFRQARMTDLIRGEMAMLRPPPAER
jgi:hypothetical protein